MKFIFGTLLLFLNVICFAQIPATTANGRAVILNNDGTWKYADGTPVNVQPCQQNKTGNITVANNGNSDIYFYYAMTQGNWSGETQYIKIKAKTSKTISNLSYGYLQGQYKWKALLELAGPRPEIEYLEGIAAGTFQVIVCDNTDVEVDD